MSFTILVGVLILNIRDLVKDRKKYRELKEDVQMNKNSDFKIKIKAFGKTAFIFLQAMSLGLLAMTVIGVIMGGLVYLIVKGIITPGIVMVGPGILVFCIAFHKVYRIKYKKMKQEDDFGGNR